MVMVVSLPLMTLDQGTAWEGYRPGLLLFISQALWGGLLMVATTEEGFLVYPTVSDITQLVNTNLPQGMNPTFLVLFRFSLPLLPPALFFHSPISAPPPHSLTPCPT